MADGRVAGRCLHLVDRPLVGPPTSVHLDASMLIAERDLEMKDILAMTLETEMARLDDTRVDGPDGDLVDLRAGHGEEVDDPRRMAAPRRRPQASRPARPE